MVKKETEISSGKGSWDMSTDRRGTAIVINLFPMYWLPAKRDAVIDTWLWILPPEPSTSYRFHHLSTADTTTYTTTCLENRVKDFRSVHNSAKLNVIKPRWNINFHVALRAMSNEEILPLARNIWIMKFSSRLFFLFLFSFFKMLFTRRKHV